MRGHTRNQARQPCALFSLNVATCARPNLCGLYKSNPEYCFVEASPSRVFRGGLGSFPASRPISCSATSVHGEFKFCRKME